MVGLGIGVGLAIKKGVDGYFDGLRTAQQWTGLTGGTSFWGAQGKELEIKARALHPLVSEEDARMIVQASSKAGYIGGKDNAFKEYLQTNIINGIKDVEGGLEIFQNAIEKGGGSVDTLKFSMDRLRETASTTDASLQIMVRNFKANVEDLAGLGARGNANISASLLQTQRMTGSNNPSVREWGGIDMNNPYVRYQTARSMGVGFTGVPGAMQHMSGIEIGEMQSNILNNAIPSSFQNMTSTEMLDSPGGVYAQMLKLKQLGMIPDSYTEKDTADFIFEQNITSADAQARKDRLTFAADPRNAIKPGTLPRLTVSMKAIPFAAQGKLARGAIASGQLMSGHMFGALGTMMGWGQPEFGGQLTGAYQNLNKNEMGMVGELDEAGLYNPVLAKLFGKSNYQEIRDENGNWVKLSDYAASHKGFTGQNLADKSFRSIDTDAVNAELQGVWKQQRKSEGLDDSVGGNMEEYKAWLKTEPARMRREQILSESEEKGIDVLGGKIPNAAKYSGIDDPLQIAKLSLAHLKTIANSHIIQQK